MTTHVSSDLGKFAQTLTEGELIGGIALALFAAITVEKNGPGVFTASESGFTWINTLDQSSKQLEVCFALGTLKFGASILTSTISVAFDEDGEVQSGLMMVQFLGDSSSVKLEINSKNLGVKTAKPIFGKQDESGNKLLSGYTKPTEDDPLCISFDCPGMIFEIYTREDGSKGTELKWLGVDGESFSGYQEIDQSDRVLVLPWLYDVGVYLKHMVIDLSSGPIDAGKPVIPGIVDGNWKGVYVKEIELLIPVGDDGFLVAGGGELIIGTDGMFAGRLGFDNVFPNRDYSIHSLKGDILIKEGKVTQGSLTLGICMDTLIKIIAKKHGSCAKDILKGKIDQKVDGISSAGGISGILYFGMDTFFTEDLCGIELYLKSFANDNQEKYRGPNGLIFPSEISKYLLFALGVAGGAFYLKKGLEEGEDSKKAWACSIGLLVLSALDVALNWKEEGTYPNTLSLNKLSLRIINWKNEVQQSCSTYQLLISAGVQFKFTADFLNKLLEIFHFNQVIGLFGIEPKDLNINGPLDLRFDNLRFDFGETLSDNANKTLQKGARDNSFGIKVTSLPDICIKSIQQGKQYPVTISINRIELVTAEGKLGLAFYFDGIGGKVSLSMPPGGIVLYCYPDFSLELKPPALLNSTYKVLIPGACLVEGTVGIDQPLPSLGGSQNKTAVKVGIIKNGKDQYSLASYMYQFGGQFVWGTVQEDNQYDFWFAEIHYRAKSPAITIGFVGIYGLGGLVGKNIAPGYTGSQKDAVGLAKWFLPDVQQNCKKMLEWSDTPGTSTWHPQAENTVGGLTVEAGPAGSGGKTFSADGVLLVGFPDWMVAVAAKLKLNLLNLVLDTVVVYAKNSLAIRTLVDWAVQGIINTQGVLEFATVDNNFWVYLGHYDEQKGTPVNARFLDLFDIRFYLVYDTQDLKDFGLTIDGDQQKPCLSGPALGLGGLFEFNPSEIGPSFLHVKLYVGASYNIAAGFNPFYLFGDLYLGGYLLIKIFWFTFRIGVMSYLRGMVGGGKFHFSGHLEINIDLQWPLPDIESTIDFSFPEDKPELPEPQFAVELASRYSLEKKAFELSKWASNEVTPELKPVEHVPIDGILALKFNKSIAKVNFGPTKLLEVGQTSNELAEIVVNKEYSTKYTYEIEDFTLTYDCPTPLGTTSMRVECIQASWAPVIEQDGQTTSVKEHQVLYLGSWDKDNELDVSPTKLGQYLETQPVNVKPPCSQEEVVCVPDRAYPPVGDSAQRFVCFPIWQGQIKVSEHNNYRSPYGWEKDQRLDWEDNSLLRLPYRSIIKFPASTKISMLLRVKCLKSYELSSGSVIDLPYSLLLEIHMTDESRKYNMKIVLDSSHQLQVVLMDPELASLVRSSVRFVNGDLEITLEQEGKSNVCQILICGPQVVESSLQGTDGIDVEIQGIKRSMLLRQLCIVRKQDQPLSWSDIVKKGTEANRVIADPDTIQKLFLLEPDKNYNLSFKLKWTGQALCNGKELECKSGEQTVKLHFQTEKFPSQDVAKYVGITVPEGENVPLYPGHLIPLIALRYRGLIKKIYEKHFGNDPMVISIVDMAGAEIQAELKDSYLLEVKSGASDAYTEEVAKNCLAEFRGVTYLETLLWSKELHTATRYSLQVRLQNSVISPKGFKRLLYNAPFKTSRYKTFGEHINLVNEGIKRAVLLPVVDDAQALSKVSDLLKKIIDGNHPGSDQAIEEVYLQILGFSSGLLSSELGQQEEDFAAKIVLQEAGAVKTLGIVLELAEPLEKPGFAFTGADLQFATKGVTRLGSDIVLLSDRSGARLLALKRSGEQVVTIENDFDLPVEFDPVKIYQQSVDKYVAAELIGKVEECKNVKDAITSKINQSGVGERLAIQKGVIQILK